MIFNESFVELSARQRAKAILDKGTFKELLDPFEKLKSPHLLSQGIVAQNDDGMVIGKGIIDGRAALVISMEGNFQGGGIGEIAGAKFAGALELALEDNKNGISIQPIILFDTGGVRLQEANYGLLAISEIQSAIVELRKYIPVIGVIPGRIGCFGGMAMTSGLFSYLLMTKEGRLTLNGPEVIEQEAGIMEWDASDKANTWNTIGGANRVATGFADILVEDSTQDIIDNIKICINKGIPTHRSSQIEKYQHLLKTIDANNPLTPDQLKEHLKHSASDKEKLETIKGNIDSKGRGYAWFKAITGEGVLQKSKLPSVLCTDCIIDEENARVIAVVPDSETYYKRSKNGEVGLEQGFEIARCVREAVNSDKGKKPRPIIAIVDVPSQAYGYKEELLGIFLSCASAVDAYSSARLAGHPVITIIVGNAISGAFLAHGLQGSYMISLNDEKITVHAMSKKSAARITKRSISDMENAASVEPGIAYDINSFNLLGAVNKLLTLSDHDTPSKEDIEKMIKEISRGILCSKEHDNKLSIRLESENAKNYRKLSIDIRQRLKKQWN